MLDLKQENIDYVFNQDVSPEKIYEQAFESYINGIFDGYNATFILIG